ncbi:MAG: hypothetical protein ACFCBV_11625 [Phycisphaerales bacterium]
MERESRPTAGKHAGQQRTTNRSSDDLDFPLHVPTSAELEAQLVRACSAMRSWDGVAALPSNPVLVLNRDRDNRLLLAGHPELALLIVGRIRENQLRALVLRDCWRTLAGYTDAELLGLCRNRWHPSTTEAILLRELTARFVEKGVSPCA